MEVRKEGEGLTIPIGKKNRRGILCKVLQSLLYNRQVIVYGMFTAFNFLCKIKL